MLDLTRHIEPGAGIWWSQGSAEPEPLVHALLDQIEQLGPHRAFCGLTWDRRLTKSLPDELSIVSYGALGRLRTLSRSGRLDVVPCHYSALPRMFAEGALPADVGFVQVSPPDSDGICSLGVGVDYAADALRHTPVLLAEVNSRMPVTRGTPGIPIDRFAATVRTDRPLHEAPVRPPEPEDVAIARHVAELVNDGDTIQLGVGAIPSAVLESLVEHQDLGFHTGLISDGIMRLVEKGVATGARKEIDPGVIVTGTVLGSTEFYDALGDLPIEFRPASYTHAPETLSRLRSLVSVNSATAADLCGQVGAEVRGDAYIGAVGGQVDFSRAAALTGARSIIAMRARNGEESTITHSLPRGIVTTARSDVDVIVTEFGVAHLRGRTLAERAHRLIAIAASEHQDSLERTLAQSGPDS